MLAVEEVKRTRIWVPVGLVCPPATCSPSREGVFFYMIRRKNAKGLVCPTLQNRTTAILGDKMS